ncbi:MAG TPA: aminoacyl-tRNA hydrolase [Clostridiales bacterium]|nr:aminoacyl-tRNA hydrolase [Clostridiales bacterium]
MSIFDLFKQIETQKPQPTTPPTFMIVGLGNPGEEYKKTRHNAGFCALDALAASLGVSVDRAKFSALVGTANLAGETALLMKPLTFMNLSGKAVAEAANFYKIPPERILVLHDEISFAPGVIRIRKKGSAGGHNGLKSIIASLGSENFPRIKIGVGQKPHPDYDLADWVLGTPPEEDRAAIAARHPDIISATRLIAEGKIEEAMNRYPH